MPTSLVFGSNSFSGSSFINYLLKQESEIIAVSRSAEANTALLRYKWAEQKNITFYQLDINKDFSEIAALLNKTKPQFIYNFAAQSMVGQSWSSPEDWFQTNTVALARLITCLINKDWLEKYIHVSTPEVYGTSKGFVQETNAFNPTTPYAISRVAGDQLTLTLHKILDSEAFRAVFIASHGGFFAANLSHS